VEFSGRASHLHLSLLAIGIYGLGLLLFLVLFGSASYDPVPRAVAFLSLPALGLGLALFSWYLYRAARQKTLAADDSGIRFSVGERTEWEIPWKGVLLLLSFRIPPEMDGPPTYGFELLADGKAYSVSEDRDIGPESRLREAFRSLAAEALRRGIPVNDKCGWAAELILENEYMKGQAFPRPELEGLWHLAEGLSKGTPSVSKRIWLAMVIAGTASVSAVAGLVFSAIAQIPAIVVLPLTAVLFVTVILLAERTSIHRLRIGEECLTLNVYAGKDIAIPWPEIREVRVVLVMGRTLMSVVLPDRRECAGVFSGEVCEAVRGRYAARRFGRPEAG
jgi:hypothetical protein